MFRIIVIIEYHNDVVVVFALNTASLCLVVGGPALFWFFEDEDVDVSFFDSLKPILQIGGWLRC